MSKLMSKTLSNFCYLASMSYTTPQTHIGKKTPFRSYVHFYYEGKLVRIYNGKELGATCNPNNQAIMADRKRELARLCSLITTELKQGWYPGKQAEEAALAALPPALTLVETIQVVQKRYPRNGWSDSYVKDMMRLTNEFISFLNTHHPLTTVEKIRPVHLAAFLDAYRSSGRYYMNKRRNLSALYKLLGTDTNPVAATPTMKVVEELNEPYTPERMAVVLTHLEQNHPGLYLCALMTYGTLLRPHREIRLLRRGDFDEPMSFITISGKGTKSGKIRKVPVPGYVREYLIETGIAQFAAEHYMCISE